MSVPFAVSVIVAVHLIVGLAGQFSTKLSVRYGLAVDKVLVDNEYGRLWSASWIHSHWSHLLLNVLILIMISFGIHWPFGTVEFLFVYFTSQLGGNLLALYTYRDDRSGQYDAIGAASGISGVLFASIALQPSLTIVIPMLGSLPAWLLAITFLVVSVFTFKPYSSTMIHDAHLGGAIVGLLTTPLVAPEVLQDTLGIAVGILVPTVVLFYAWVKAPENVVLHPWKPSSDRRALKINESVLASQNYDCSYESTEEEMNALLDKINQRGYRSLSAHERARLRNISGKASTGIS